MKRPQRTIKRESLATYRGKQLVLIVPPTCDVILIREKGRHQAYELDILSAYHLAAKKAATPRKGKRS